MPARNAPAYSARKPARDVYKRQGVNTKQIYRSSKLLSNITGVPIPPSKAIVGANAFAHESRCV